MTRDDLVRDTYAHFGLAIYKAQVLEHGIVNAMVIARMPERGKVTRQDIDAFMGQQFKSTLGRLLREMRKITVVPDNLGNVLEQALARRNWLVHNYFGERAEEFVTDPGCHRMIAELESAQELFDQASQSVDLLVRPIRERFGLTDEAIATEVQKSMIEN